MWFKPFTAPPLTIRFKEIARPSAPVSDRIITPPKTLFSRVPLCAVSACGLGLYESNKGRHIVGVNRPTTEVLQWPMKFKRLPII